MFSLPIRSKKYGWIPDLPDQRDYPYSLLKKVIPKLPKKIDFREICTAVENQSSLGSCTACALVGNLEFLKRKKLKKTINFSKLFLYYNERAIRHTIQTDSGASLRDGIKILVKLGDCLEKLWPYNIKLFIKRPTNNAYKNALNYQIKAYYRLSDIQELKHTLSDGYPFVFGMAIYESFESKKTAKSGKISLPTANERLLGGHAMMVVGYDDFKRYFIVRNSWGEKWGNKGYGYLPYQYLSPLLTSDFWTIRDME